MQVATVTPLYKARTQRELVFINNQAAMGFPSAIPTLVRYIVVSARSARLRATMPTSSHITLWGRFASEKIVKSGLFRFIFML